MTANDDADFEADLTALLEGRLDPRRAFDIADHLASRPEDAARLLAEARTTAGLRLALEQMPPEPPTRLNAEARRLQTRLQRRRTLRHVAPVAIMVALFAAGWAAHAAVEELGSDSGSPLVNAALDAQNAIELRKWMRSQAANPMLDADEIAAAIGIELPPLPTDWTVREVEIVAAPERPGLAIAFDVKELGPVMLFATIHDGPAINAVPSAFAYEGRTVAVYENGRSAFVLVDDFGNPEQLLAKADALVASAR